MYYLSLIQEVAADRLHSQQNLGCFICSASTVVYIFEPKE